VASAHWPVIWPSPGAGELSIHRGPDSPSHLELPLAPVGPDAVPAPHFREKPPALVEFGSETSEPIRWEVVEDHAAGTVMVRTHEASMSVMPDGASTLFVGEALEMTASEREPGHGRFENACEYRLDSDGHQITIVADGTTVATSTALEMEVGIRVELDGMPFFERDWHEVIPRDLL